MPFSNGGGNTGGNTSVFWEVNGNGKSGRPVLANARPVAQPSASTRSLDAKPTAFELVDFSGHPGRGEVALTQHGVSGHTDTHFNDIGTSDPRVDTDRPGHFRVRLRFRDDDLKKMDQEQVKWLMQRAKRMPELEPKTPSWFVEIDVPAIHREQPNGAAAWDEQPWEIHWEW